jgi:hypothetical protein
MSSACASPCPLGNGKMDCLAVVVDPLGAEDRANDHNVLARPLELRVEPNAVPSLRDLRISAPIPTSMRPSLR